jgi:uncharacterized membrane protein
MTGMRVVFERLRSTFWVLPALGIAVAIVAALVIPILDRSIALPDTVSFSGSSQTARATLQIIATVAVSVAGISFSVIVVALVLASQQLSPRVLRSFQRHPLNQTVLGLFLATAAFSLFVLGGFDDSRDPVPETAVSVAMILAAISLVTFVFFLHYLVRSLNASAVIRRIAAEGHQAVEGPYPAGVGDSPSDGEVAAAEARRLVERGTANEVRAPRAGYLASVEAAHILAGADECDGFVEQRHAIGEFVITGGLLAVAWCSDDRADELCKRVERAFVLEEERLVEDDVAFPLRQLADMALKGLSAGINDPTTAENAMDSVTDTLTRVACQPAPELLRLAHDGTPRFRAATPSLDALVRLGFDEVGRDGAARPSFAVRLLELLATLRDLGGERAAHCSEVGTQARSIADRAVARADIAADAELVRDAYDRLHGRARGIEGDGAHAELLGTARSTP